jgi:hypothetical protein
MKILATAHALSSASADAFFARWSDHSTWSQWSPDSEWVRLDGPVAQGTSGVLKPKGGPEVRFSITALVEDREYTDTSKFPGATLVFQHLVQAEEDRTKLDVQVSISGPLAWLWAGILGGGFRKSVPADLDRLVALVEANR